MELDDDWISRDFADISDYKGSSGLFAIALAEKLKK